jgi:hypothetical protein
MWVFVVYRVTLAGTSRLLSHPTPVIKVMSCACKVNIYYFYDMEIGLSVLQFCEAGLPLKKRSAQLSQYNNEWLANVNRQSRTLFKLN